MGMKVTVYKDIFDEEHNNIYIDKYISFFREHLQNKIELEDGSFQLEGELASNDFISKQLEKFANTEEFRKWVADTTLDKLHTEITSTGMKLCPINLFTLCQYILYITREQYVVLLKPTIADTLAELKDVKAISFINGDDKTVTTSNKKLIKQILDNLKAEETTEYEADKIVRIDKMIDKSLIQANFTYYVALFLKEYFKDYPRRSNCCMVSSIEQKLILYLLYFFGLSQTPLTDSRFRQLISQYHTQRININYSNFQDVGFIPVDFVKYKDWKDGLNWNRLDPIKKGETIKFKL